MDLAGARSSSKGLCLLMHHTILVDDDVHRDLLTLDAWLVDLLGQERHGLGG